MKTHRILISLAAIAAGSFALTAAAAETKKGAAKAEKKESAPEWAELFGGASLPVVWQSANAAADKIAAAISAKSFDGVADWAETLHLASHALEDQVKLADAERQKRLKGALEQAAKIADEVLDAGNHKEAEKLADSFRRMNAALKLAATRLPKEITDAPKQEVRFAKASGHAHDDKGDHVEKKKK
jgi:hypothetical protein